jgi:hypothetical protein
MAKSKDSSTYHPLIRRIFAQALSSGSFTTAPMEERSAHSLRYDLNGFKKALLFSEGGTIFSEDCQFASVSIYKVKPGEFPNTPPDFHYIKVTAAGPQWTDSLTAIMPGFGPEVEGQGLTQLKPKPKPKEVSEPEPPTDSDPADSPPEYDLAAMLRATKNLVNPGEQS